MKILKISLDTAANNCFATDKVCHNHIIILFQGLLIVLPFKMGLKPNEP